MQTRGPVDMSRIDAPYCDDAEFYQDALELLDALIYEKCVLGETQDLLSAPAQLCAPIGDDSGDIALYMKSRLALGGFVPAFVRAANQLRLDAALSGALLLSIAGTLDSRYYRVFASLSRNFNNAEPTLALAAWLFGQASYARTLTRLSESFSLALALDPAMLKAKKLRPCSALINHLFGTDNHADSAIDEYWDLYNDKKLILEACVRKQERAIIRLRGHEGCGRHTLVKRACAGAGAAAVFCAPDDSAIADAAVKALLTGATLCVQDADTVNMPLLCRLLDMLSPVIILVNAVLPSYSGDIPAVDMTLDGITSDEREALFELCAKKYGLSAGVSTGELASKFIFDPARIKAAFEHGARASRLGGKDEISYAQIHESCYAQTSCGADALTTVRSATFTWNDIVLPSSSRALLEQACEHVRYKYKVYTQWGFAEKLQYNRGVSMLFSGPPGTGKTLAAQIMANELQMRLNQIQLSQVVSKYVGETEKNLEQVFSQAKRSSAILFFDECDALFGKRSEVRDAQDRHANVEVAYLLQQMEEYDGVTIMATNLSQNIDPAFMRRLQFAVHFPFPDAAARMALYRKLLPAQTPLRDDVDFAFMADTFKVAGGNIRNIVLHAAFMAASGNRPVGMRELITAAVNDMRKNDIVVVREDLREYADLLDAYQ